SSGLGRTLTEEFTAAGHEVHGFSRASGVDARDAVAVEAFAAGIGKPVALWVNNAGVLGPLGRIDQVDAAEMAANIEINVIGYLNGTQSFLRHRSPDGVLINVASASSTYPVASMAVYCTAKAAVHMLTVTTEQHGVRAYAVDPGPMDTVMQEQLRDA